MQIIITFCAIWSGIVLVLLSINLMEQLRLTKLDKWISKNIK